jgi:polyisoprenoid-binding protein YceI
MPTAEPNPPSQVAPVPAGTYVVDPQRSEVRFRAKAFGMIWVRGSMPVVEGTVQVTDGRLSGTGEIAADAVDTGVGARDRHLRTSHYLGTKQHPRIQVAADDVAIGSGRADCTVTVRGTAAGVPVEVREITASGDTLRIEGVVELDRTPYPMLPPLAGVSRTVHVEVTVLATRTATGG